MSKINQTKTNQTKTNTLIGSLKSTFQLKTINEKTVPFQNGIPYPSFEPQPRLTLSLEGKWKKKRFESDHDWSMSERDHDWIARTEEEVKGITTEEFNSKTWESHQIPLPENHLSGKAEVNAAETYQNGVWYRRKFQLDEEWGEKVVTLKCLGVSYIGDFWINGVYVGYHEGGFTPFAFDISKFVHLGENTIVARIDNPPWTSRIDTVPAVDNDFFNYTGIIHDIYLEATSGIHVVRTDIVPRGVNGIVEVSTVIENRTDYKKKVSLCGKVFETDFSSENWLEQPCAKSIIKEIAKGNELIGHQVELASKETKVISYQTLIESPKLWSIREPNLYVLETVLFDGRSELDSIYTQFGIRTIQTEKAQILLNGEPIFLAGIARHEEWPEFGRTATWSRIKSDFLQIANLKVNMVRTAHYPNHLYTFIMLDRLGLTAMSEIPLWQFETKHYEAQEERGISYQMWREMIFSNYNRPSIIMWSTQNESKDIMLRKKYNERLVNEVRIYYNDERLITQSAAADQPGYDDESMEPLDVLGWTMYFGIFHGSTPYEGTRNFIEMAHKRWPEKPIINTEYGIWSNADSSFLEKQVEIYEQVQLALLEKATVSPQGIQNKNGYLAGMDYWTIFDWYVNHNSFYQTMGIFHMDRVGVKLLTNKFIQDHDRLMGKYNGIAKKIHTGETSIYLTPLVRKEIAKEKVCFELEKSMDMTPFNYFVLKVYDQNNSNGFIVQLVNSKGKVAKYETFDIQTDHEFHVCIPLWNLEKEVIRNVASVRVLIKQPRELEIIDLLCSLDGI